MPYLGKQPAASALVVESGSIQSAEIEDGTIEDSDISSDFKGLLSGSAVVNASSVTAASISGSITSTGSFGSLSVADSVQGNLTLGGNLASAGELTIDAETDIVLDANGADIKLKDDGTEFGRISRVSSDLVIKSISNNNDILFKGVDASSTITALSLDMSEGGNAEFSGNVSGSLVSTASFGSVNATHLNGVFEGTLGSVANALISGSTVVNAPNISGSITSTGSFGSLVVADKVQGNLDLGGNITAAGDISTSGSIFAREFHTEFTSASVMFASGSNKFGDDSGDTHRFTGSMLVSGSITMADGDLSVTDNLDVSGNVTGSITSTASFASAHFMGTGGVGVGTDAPADELEVHGATAAIKIRSTGTSAGNNPSINFQSTEATGLAARAEISADDDGATTKGALIFKTRISDSVTEAMRIDGTGNVGIGTDSPTGQLTIASSTSPSLTFKDTGGGAGSKIFKLAGGGDKFFFEGRNDADDGDGDAGSIMTFDLTAIKVGIGTGSPAKTLHIVGATDDGLFEGLQIDNTDHASGETGQSVAINMRLAQASTMRDAGRITIGKDDDWDDAAATDSHMTFKTMLNNTLTEQMRLKGGGDVGVGTTNPDGRFHIHNNSAGSVTANGDANELVIENNGTTGISILCPAANQAEIAFGDPDDNNVGRFAYNHPGDYFAIVAAASEIMRISGSGNVGIGTNSPGDIRLVVRDNSTTTGTGDPVTSGTNASSSLFRVQPRFNSVLDIGQGADPYPIWIQAADISNLAQYYELSLNPVGGHVGIGTLNPQDELHVDNGTASSGCFIRVQNDGTTGYVGAGLILNAKNAHQRGAGVFMHNQYADKGFYAGVIYNVAFERYSICYEARALQDESTADSAHEIVQIQTDGDYLSTTGTDIQQISDRRLKENIQDFTGGLDVLKNLQPRTFEWKEGRGNNRFGRTGTQYGFIAQEIESGSGVVDNMNLYKKVDIVDGELDSDILDGTKYQSQLNAKDALYISAIKELSEKIELQQKQIEELKEGQNG
jgi:cytoskeletal protein CcmA (bactofilin family)